jgi:hypothetical protein
MELAQDRVRWRVLILARLKLRVLLPISFMLLILVSGPFFLNRLNNTNEKGS